MADLTFILDHLATGGALAGAQDVAQLFGAGITHVIDCQAEQDDAPLFMGSKMTYLWNPAADDGQPKPVDWFAKSIAFAIPALAVAPGVPLSPRPRVYAHCAAGHNRGPSTVYAILLALGWPYDDAEALIRTRRPQVTLAYKADAITAISALGY